MPDINYALHFALFGLDREMPDWVPIFGGHILHLGAGNKSVANTIPLDWPDWNAEVDQIPYADNSINGAFCTHFLEHLSRDGFYHVLRELGRVLVDGAPFNILVPHAQSLMYLQDLDHETPFVLETWKTLLSNPYYGKDKNAWPFRIGANFTFAIAERNTALVTQLIREDRS